MVSATVVISASNWSTTLKSRKRRNHFWSWLLPPRIVSLRPQHFSSGALHIFLVESICLFMQCIDRMYFGIKSLDVVTVVCNEAVYVNIRVAGRYISSDCVWAEIAALLIHNWSVLYSKQMPLWPKIDISHAWTYRQLTCYAPGSRKGGNKRCFCPSVRLSVRPSRT